MRKFNLTVSEYRELVARPCEICGTQEGRICVDHDHESGEVRGVLCVKCNSALGMLDDDPIRAYAAGMYLDAFNDRALEHDPSGDEPLRLPLTFAPVPW